MDFRKSQGSRLTGNGYVAFWAEVSLNSFFLITVIDQATYNRYYSRSPNFVFCRTIYVVSTIYVQKYCHIGAALMSILVSFCKQSASSSSRLLCFVFPYLGHFV